MDMGLKDRVAIILHHRCVHRRGWRLCEGDLPARAGFLPQDADPWLPLPFSAPVVRTFTPANSSRNVTTAA